MRLEEQGSWRLDGHQWMDLKVHLGGSVFDHLTNQLLAQLGGPLLGQVLAQVRTQLWTQLRTQKEEERS